MKVVYLFVFNCRNDKLGFLVGHLERSLNKQKAAEPLFDLAIESALLNGVASGSLSQIARLPPSSISVEVQTHCLLNKLCQIIVGKLKIMLRNMAKEISKCKVEKCPWDLTVSDADIEGLIVNKYSR